MPRPSKKWTTVSELAKTLGVTTPTASAHVARLEATAGLKCRRRGRLKLVDFDKFSALRAAEATQRDEARGADQSLRRQQTRKAAIAGDLAKIELDKRRAQLVPRRQVEEAMVTAAAALSRIFSRLPEHAEALAAATTKDGSAGARRALRELGLNLRRAMAEAMHELAAPTSKNEVHLNG